MRFDHRLPLLAVMVCCLATIGCSRRHYRLRADTDAVALLNEKSAGTPWQLPRSYSVYPDPDSRLADPTDPDFPLLPSPGPILYSDGSTFRSKREEEVEPPPASMEDVLPEPEPLPELQSPDRSPEAELPPLPRPRPGQTDQARSLRRLPRVITHVGMVADGVQLASYQGTLDEGAEAPLPDGPQEAFGGTATALPIQPIPPTSWQALPESCLRHMLEFESVQDEYEKSFPEADDEAQVAPARRLTLREIVDLAVRNSREYQSAEEALYVAALDVSLQRYDYQLKFTPSGNGIDANWDYLRVNRQTTNNTLVLPSSLGVEKTLAKGGTFITQFANDVVLNFNGAQGVTSRISSDLLFGFTQSILQRDILLDPLIQSERDLVYATREFARFRKEFFFNVARDYYEILREYRGIEIESQNYFSLVRTLEQANAEVRAGVTNAPNQVTVDQFEQGMLSGRRELISISNALDQSLDSLKIRIGLPTDLPIDIDLGELEQLTLFDEIEVAVERIRRWEQRVVEQRNKRVVNRADLVNAGIYMIDRVFEWAKLQAQYDGQAPDLAEIEELYSRLQLEQAHNDVERSREAYDQVSRGGIQEQTILVYLRINALLDATLKLIDGQLRGVAARQPDLPLVVEGRQEWRRGTEALRQSRNVLEQNPSDEQLDAMVAELRPELAALEALAANLDQTLKYDPNADTAERDSQALRDTERLLALAAEIIGESGAGLPDVDIEVNDAMLTALIQRLDLMNERGFLADDWRRIKFASDELRSVLNLSAQQRLSTINDEGFLNFDEDDLDITNTQVRLSLDLPLNRRAQRNAYRRSLFNYQRGRRDLMAFEDGIKLEIRNRLRTVDLIRVQYPIAVTRAALAAEQVISIRLQLALGTPNVRGRDLLDALQDSRTALRDVAGLRIGDLVNRAQFVLDMELMQLDDNGFWPQINDPDYQPEPNLMYPPTAGPTYGEIPRYVKPSRLMYHIYCHPRPGERIEQVEPPLPQEADASDVPRDE